MDFVRKTPTTHDTSDLSYESRFWNSLHGLLVQPKVETFIWRVSQNILPIGKNLVEKDMIRAVNRAGLTHTRAGLYPFLAGYGDAQTRIPVDPWRVINVHRKEKIEKYHTGTGIPIPYPRPWRVGSGSKILYPGGYGSGSGSKFNYEGTGLGLGTRHIIVESDSLSAISSLDRNEPDMASVFFIAQIGPSWSFVMYIRRQLLYPLYT
ncbi:hypothetical protein M9H77_08503 [Catharanthus roseus]|uniref:Uncharacterized protein n=1 Tax=Catharanthus roseus TaxID=4058 RepID=A0ACC0BY98_CATRO|nr:hypothetical protein M9H77_08503 [Catharanthus roseus]